MQEMKKRIDEDSGLVDQLEEGKKRSMRDIDNLQTRLEGLTAENDNLAKAKKKFQQEVCYFLFFFIFKYN